MGSAPVGHAIAQFVTNGDAFIRIILATPVVYIRRPCSTRQWLGWEGRRVLPRLNPDIELVVVRPFEERLCRHGVRRSEALADRAASFSLWREIEARLERISRRFYCRRGNHKVFLADLPHLERDRDVAEPALDVVLLTADGIDVVPPAPVEIDLEKLLPVS